MHMGRNERCWCGSGRKYKRCHLNRETAQPIARHEVHQKRKKVMDKRYCMHASNGRTMCSGAIVKAHTVPRGCLKKIAEQGHVCHLGPADGRGELWGSLPPLQEVGLKNASTFTGFCRQHDNDLFAPIEDRPFHATQQHAFLLAYRALCRELFWKRIHQELVPDMREADRGMPHEAQMQIQRNVTGFQDEVDVGRRELGRHKRIYDAAWQTQDFSKVRFHIAWLDSCPQVMCSGGITPEYDFHGALLHDIMNVGIEQDNLTFTQFPVGNKGAAVFAWMEGGTGVCEGFVNSLQRLDDKELPSAFVRFAFEFLENIWFSRAWWEGLDRKAQRSVRERARSGRLSHPMRSHDCLCDDGFDLASWEVTGRDSNS